MRKFLGTLLLSFSATALAYGKMKVAAPELDVASAAAALTLLSGGLVVIRGRRKKR